MKADSVSKFLNVFLFITFLSYGNNYVLAVNHNFQNNIFISSDTSHKQIQIDHGKIPKSATIQLYREFGCLVNQIECVEILFNGSNGYVLQWTTVSGERYSIIDDPKFMIFVLNNMNRNFAFDSTIYNVKSYNPIYKSGTGYFNLKVNILFSDGQTINNNLRMDGLGICGPYLTSFYNYLISLNQKWLKPLTHQVSIDILSEYSSRIAEIFLDKLNTNDLIKQKPIDTILIK